MLRAAFLPWPMATVTVRSAGHHVAAGEDARAGRSSGRGRPRRRRRVMTTPGTPSSSDSSASWPSASTSGVGVELARTRRLAAGKPASSSIIFSITSLPSSAWAIVDSHMIRTPSSAPPPPRCRGPASCSRVRRYTTTASVGAQPPGGPGGVHRGVAAAVDRDPASELAAAPRPPSCAGARPRRGSRRSRRPGCRRACPCCAPTARNAASNCRRPWPPRGR